MPRAIGLEVTDTVVRVADLDGTPRTLRLLHFAEREIRREADRPWADCAAEAIAALFAELKLPRDRVVASLDSGDVLIRFLALPFKNDDQIQKVVKFELESQLQNYSADDLIVDYITAEQSEKGTLLLTAAAPKKVVRERLALFEKAGIDPVALDLDVNALFNAFARGIDLQSDEPFVLVHGGTRFTKLVFIQRKIPRFVRTLRFALGASGHGRAPGRDAAMTRAAGAAEPEAGAGPAAETAVAAEPFVLVPEGAAGIAGDSPALSPQDRIALLGREVSRFLLSSLSPTAPTCLLLTGEFVRHPEVAPRMEEVTQLVTDTVDFLTGIEHPHEEGQAPSHVAIPLGLALKGLDIDRTRLDFRKEEFVHQRRFELIKKTLAASVFLTVILFFLLAVHFQFQWGDYAAQLDVVLGHQQKLFEDTFPAEPGKPPPPLDRDRIVEEMVKAKDAEAERIGQNLPLRTTALDHTLAVFEKLRDYLTQQTSGGRNADFHIGLDRFTCSLSPQAQWPVEFAGEIAGPPLAEGLKNLLGTVPEFESPMLDNVNARPDGKYSYTIRVKVRKPEAGN